MYNLNHRPKILGVKSWREITCGGTRTKTLNITTLGLPLRSSNVECKNIPVNGIRRSSGDSRPICAWCCDEATYNYKYEQIVARLTYYLRMCQNCISLDRQLYQIRSSLPWYCDQERSWLVARHLPVARSSLPETAIGSLLLQSIQCIL
jgi:hypothetical protein